VLDRFSFAVQIGRLTKSKLLYLVVSLLRDRPPSGTSTGASLTRDMMADPVSGLQIEQGWNVVSADGTLIGTVAQVAGDPHDDIFDGLAVTGGSPAQLRYVPGEQVGGIFPGEVTLKITASESGAAWKRRSRRPPHP